MKANNPNRRIGRPSNYLKSMRNNPYWERVKKEVRMRDGYKCTKCGKVGGYEVHHLTYTKNGVSIRGKELDHLECLTLLCSNCHKEIHNR